MRLLEILRLSRRPETADTARQRLQAVIVLERDSPSVPDFLPLLQHELLQVIEKYIKLDRERVNVGFERGETSSTLEVNIELPPNAGHRDEDPATRSRDPRPGTTRLP